MTEMMDSIAQLRRQSAIDELLSVGWLQHLSWQSEVDSTNNLAKQYIQQFSGHSLPSLFVSDRQTAGRGRSGNSWWSPDGCLMFTLLIDSSQLPTDASRYPQLALVVGLAMCEMVNHILGDQVGQLKWPNDLYVQNRKLAGILIESLQSRPQQPAFAIGVGINVDIDWRQAPAKLREQAGCLSSFGGRQIYRESVLVEFIQRIENHLQHWCIDADYWRDPWRQRSLLNGRIVTAQVGDELVIGRCEGIDEMGRLLLRDEMQMHVITAAHIIEWQ